MTWQSVQLSPVEYVMYMVMKKATTIRRPMQDENLCTMSVEDPSTNRADTIIPAMYVNLLCMMREPLIAGLSAPQAEVAQLLHTASEDLPCPRDATFCSLTKFASRRLTHA